MFALTIMPDGDDPYVLECTSRDVMRWEKRGKGRSASQLNEGASLSALYEIAHIAATRQGRFDGTLNEWEDNIDLEQVDQENQEAGPTPEGR